MIEKVEFTNMCMIRDGNKVIVVNRKRKTGQELLFQALKLN